MSQDRDKPPHTPLVPSADRVLSILELVGNTRRGISLSELARRLEVPKSSCHCLVVTLERRGYLVRNSATGRYMVGSKLFSLGELALNGIAVREQAAPFLRDLMESTRLTVHLAIPDHGNAVIIDKVAAPGLVQMATWVGKRFDLHCSGVGKALLAFMPEAEFLKIVHGPGLTRYNENTLTSVRRLIEEVAEIRRRGYAVEDEEGEIGCRCIGSAIFDRTGTAIASVSVAGTISQISDANLTEIARRVTAVCNQISSLLGHQP